MLCGKKCFRLFPINGVYHENMGGGLVGSSLRWTVWLEYLQPGSIPSPIYGVLTGMASDQKTGLAGCTEIFVPLTTPDYWRQATLITDSDSPDL